jgi:hypothetical protein
MMIVTKSTRHQKVIGDYGEMLVCNWLSRSGFEVTVVDHTGIDVVAFDPKTRRRYGISVKSRTRIEGTEATSVRVFPPRLQRDARKKVTNACTAFECEPWIAVYVETTQHADLYLTSLAHYDNLQRRMHKRAAANWVMGSKHQAAYRLDAQVWHIHFEFGDNHWLGEAAPGLSCPDDALARTAGLWKDRKDLPDFRRLRREWDRR